MPESVKLDLEYAAAKASGNEDKIEEVSADYQAEIVRHQPFGVISNREESADPD